MHHSLMFASIKIYYNRSLMKSSLQLNTITPLGKEELTKLKTIWQSLQDHNDSIEFRNPVNYKAMGLYDYPQYIKYPMDLSTIHRKLREHKYRLVEQVLDDLQIIWDNCKIYNPPSSWIYNLAERLEKAFKKMVKSYLPFVPLSNNTFGLKQSHADNGKEEDNEIVEEEVPFQNKLNFVEKLRLISPPNLKAITDLISELCPKAFSEGQEGKAQILIDLIPIESFALISEKLQQILVTDRSSTKKIKLY